MIRVNFPRRGRINQVHACVRDAIHNPLHQRFRAAQAPVRKTPEIRLPIAQNFCGSPAFIGADTGFSEARTVSQDHHQYRHACAHMAGNGATTTKHLVVRVRRQHQGRECWQAGNCGVGGEIGFQWALVERG